MGDHRSPGRRQQARGRRGGARGGRGARPLRLVRDRQRRQRAPGEGHLRRGRAPGPRGRRPQAEADRGPRGAALGAHGLRRRRGPRVPAGPARVLRPRAPLVRRPQGRLVRDRRLRRLKARLAAGLRVELMGLEPTAFCVPRRRSSQLSYSPLGRSQRTAALSTPRQWPLGGTMTTAGPIVEGVMALDLDGRMAEHVGEGGALGAVWCVDRGGDAQVGWAGSLDPDGVRPVARNTIFRISSMTKPITAVAALTLVAMESVQLDDPGRPVAAGAGRSAGDARSGRVARRHGPRRASDHGASPAHVHARPRDGLLEVRPAAGAAGGHRSGAGRRSASPAGSAAARRVDPAARHAAAGGAAGRAVAVPRGRGRPRRAHRTSRPVARSRRR